MAASKSGMAAAAPRRRPREPLDLDDAKRKSTDPARPVEQPSMGTDVPLDASFISAMLLLELIDNSLTKDVRAMYTPQREIDRLASSVGSSTPAISLPLNLNPDIGDDDDEDIDDAALDSKVTVKQQPASTQRTEEEARDLDADIAMATRPSAPVPPDDTRQPPLEFVSDTD